MSNRSRTETWKVYKITSPNERVYIGCTNLELEDRFNKGLGYKYNKELWNDILYYGWSNFKTEILLECKEDSMAREFEHSEIKKYPDGYNIYRGEHIRYNPDYQPPRKAVLCVETNIVYDSIYQAAKATGCSKQKISQCCRGLKYKSTGGYHWKFV